MENYQGIFIILLFIVGVIFLILYTRKNNQLSELKKQLAKAKEDLREFEIPLYTRFFLEYLIRKILDKTHIYYRCSWAVDVEKFQLIAFEEESGEYFLFQPKKTWATKKSIKDSIGGSREAIAKIKNLANQTGYEVSNLGTSTGDENVKRLLIDQNAVLLLKSRLPYNEALEIPLAIDIDSNVVLTKEKGQLFRRQLHIYDENTELVLHPAEFRRIAQNTKPRSLQLVMSRIQVSYKDKN